MTATICTKLFMGSLVPETR